MTSLAEPSLAPAYRAAEMPASNEEMSARNKSTFHTQKSNETKAPNILGLVRPVVCNVWCVIPGLAEYSGGSYAEKLK
jgi:hypothetical protein